MVNSKYLMILVTLLLVPFYSINNFPDASAISGGNEGSKVTVKVSSLNPSTTYTVCFSTANYYCSISNTVPNAVYTFTGSALSTGSALTVPAIVGGQYYIVILNPSSTVVAAASFSITPSVITYPSSVGVGSNQKINATNLAAGTTYTICYATAPTTGCASGTSATGTSLKTGVTVIVPDLTAGLYYVNIESALSPSVPQIVASSTVTVTSPITLGASSGKEGASVTIKDPNLNPSTTYTVCFSAANYYCSIPNTVTNSTYTFTGSALVSAKTLTVPAILGGQYYVIILNPSSTVVSVTPFSITPSSITFPTSAGVGSTQTIKATNLIGSLTYTVCFTTAPTSGCSSGTSAKGTALGTGVSVPVPDLTAGLYYVNIESALSPSVPQIVATSTVAVTSPITLGASIGNEGASVTIKDASLTPSTTYTVCFSTTYYYCSIINTVPNAVYTFTGSALSTAKSLTVPALVGGQYFVVILNPSSTAVAVASFSITPSVITYPDSGAAGSSHTMKATNLIGTTTYTICFNTAPTTGCSTGVTSTGASLATGTSITVPGTLTAGLYYANVESAASIASAQQIVATSAFVVTGGTKSVLALSVHGGLEGSSVKANATNLVSGTTYTLCFSTTYYYCSVSNTVPNDVYSFTGSALATSKTLTVPALAGGQYFLVILDPSSTVMTTASFSITPSMITFTNSTGVGSTQTIKATNLVGATSYTICFTTAPTSGCSSGTSATGTSLATGTSIKVPDISSGLYYVNIESAVSPPSPQQIVATSTVAVTSPIALGASTGNEGASVTIKDSSLDPSTTYTVCFSVANYYCSISNTVPNAVYSFAGSALTTAKSLTVPSIMGGQYFVVILNPSSTVVSVTPFSITPSSITFPNSAGVGSTQTIKGTNLVGTTTYTICFTTGPTSGCSSGISATGTSLAAGVSIVVPDLTPGFYYVTIESVLSPTTPQIVATSTVAVTTPITLS